MQKNAAKEKGKKKKVTAGLLHHKEFSFSSLRTHFVGHQSGSVWTEWIPCLFPLVEHHFVCKMRPRFRFSSG